MKSISDLLNLLTIKLTFLKMCFVTTFMQHRYFVPHPLAFSVMDDHASFFSVVWVYLLFSDIIAKIWIPLDAIVIPISYLNPPLATEGERLSTD